MDGFASRRRRWTVESGQRRRGLREDVPLSCRRGRLSLHVGRGPSVRGRGGSTSETADVVSLRDFRDHRSSSAQEFTALFGPVGLDCATRGCRAAFGSRPPSSRAAWWSIESVGTRRVRWGKRLDSQTIGYERGTRGDARTEPYF